MYANYVLRKKHIYLEAETLKFLYKPLFVKRSEENQQKNKQVKRRAENR